MLPVVLRFQHLCIPIPHIRTAIFIMLLKMPVLQWLALRERIMFLKEKGKLDDTYKFITFGGDGGTYDIGFQSLSGAMERGHDMVYVCYDNGAYMNTSIQRSSATPMFADTTTTP